MQSRDYTQVGLTLAMGVVVWSVMIANSDRETTVLQYMSYDDLVLILVCFYHNFCRDSVWEVCTLPSHDALSLSHTHKHKHMHTPLQQIQSPVQMELDLAPELGVLALLHPLLVSYHHHSHILLTEGSFLFRYPVGRSQVIITVTYDPRRQHEGIKGGLVYSYLHSVTELTPCLVSIRPTLWRSCS